MSNRNAILGWIEGAGIPHVGIAYRKGEKTFFLEPDREFHAASMMKVPVMFEAFRQDASDSLRLDDHLMIENRFSSIFDGSEFSLNVEDDSEKTLYELLGERVPVRDLVELMITESSNLATNMLIKRFGTSSIADSMKAWGIEGSKVVRGVEDGKAYRAGLNNTMTARSYLAMMDRLLVGEVVSRAASDEILAILSRQKLNEAIPKGLPSGTRVAHKTGWNTDIFHDGGVVYEGEIPSFSLAVFTKGAATKADAQGFGAELTRRLSDLD
jgi:beta-lactamase class A